MKLTLGQTLKNSVLSREFYDPNWSTEQIIRTIENELKSSNTSICFYLDETDYALIEWNKLYSWLDMEDLSIDSVNHSDNMLSFIVNFTC